MIISHTNKFIFFKAPKVAGTSTEAFFEQFCDKDKDIIGLKWFQLIKIWPRPRNINKPPSNVEYWNHMSPILIKQKMLPQDWQTYLKFGNIRNPWDRMVSAYFFKKDAKKLIPYDTSFEHFIKYMKKHHPVSLYKYYAIDILQEDYKNNMYFIRQENIHEDILTICDILSLKPNHNLQHMNATKRDTDYRSYYNEETKRIVAEKYQKDIELFNYKY